MSRRRATLAFVVAGLAIALLLAGVVSNFASADPDGLDAATLHGCTVDETGAITGGSCIAQRAKDHELGGGPLADYGVFGIDNPYLSNGLAGVLGVLITFALGGGLFWLVRRRPAASRGSSPANPSPANPSPANPTQG